MVNNIKTRKEIALAKLAGYEVSYTSVTPSAARGTEEELMDEIAKRLDGFAKTSDLSSYAKTSDIPTVPTPPSAASTDTAGLVKQAVNVAVAADTAPTKAEFDALITALINAGIMAAPAE